MNSIVYVGMDVEVFRSYNNDLLPYTFSVAVLTCAALSLMELRKNHIHTKSILLFYMKE